LHPEGEEHRAEQSAGDVYVLGPVAIDIGEIQEDLTIEVLDVMGDDVVFAWDFAIQELAEVGDLRGVGVGGDDLGAFAEAGGLGDFFTYERVDHGRFADFFSAYQTYEVKALVFGFFHGVGGEDWGVVFVEGGLGGTGDFYYFFY